MEKMGLVKNLAKYSRFRSIKGTDRVNIINPKYYVHNTEVARSSTHRSLKNQSFVYKLLNNIISPLNARLLTYSNLKLVNYLLHKQRFSFL